MGSRCGCVRRVHPDGEPFISELTEKDKDRSNGTAGRSPSDSPDGGGGGGGGTATTQPVVSREEYNDKHHGSRNEGHGPPDPQPVPSPGDVLNSKEEKNVLKVVKVDLKIDENAKIHHTDRYELTQRRPAAAPVTPAAPATPSGAPAAPGATEAEPQIIEPCLVVRRGFPFDISITFDRPFSSEKDDIRLLFDFGENPRETRGSRVVLLLSDEDKPKEWGAKILYQTNDTFTVRIFTPPQVQVNKWKFGFDAILRLEEKEEEEDSSKVFRYTHDVPIYILFNPWCRDDQVFMGEDSWRAEYVLNDKGRIFFGTQSQISSMPWNFGQFEDFVLDVAMFLLDNSGLNLSLRGNPIHVVRKISALVNAPDDNGVVVGNWAGDYSGGTAPTAWNGSVAILEEFWKKREPVCYGQCWVFSAVVTTICRSLGIPCRSVTNFASAHDSDGSLTIDEYWDTSGKPMENYNQDSVWNFHVWNDVWMARPDIPDGFGGWQAVDATPQETSEGVYCVGPASVEAIRNGCVQLPYDGPFVFAEVNADRINNIQTKDGQWKHTFQENVIGKNMSTKSPDGDDRLDVTDEYKFPEGSQEERIAVWLAAATGSTKKNLYKVEAEDMKFEMIHEDDVLVGSAFDVRLKIHNNSSAQRTVKATLAATVVQYTGVPVCAIKAESKTIKVSPESEEVMKMAVKVEEYLEKLTDMCHIKISSMSQVVDTKQFYCDSDDFRLNKPDIEVEVAGEMKVGDEYEVEASFKNPLPKQLTNCEFTFEAPSLQRPVKVPHKNVSSKGSAKCTYKLTPTKEGDTEVIVGFWSKELSNLTGTAKIKVVARP